MSVCLTVNSDCLKDAKASFQTEKKIAEILHLNFVRERHIKRLEKLYVTQKVALAKDLKLKIPNNGPKKVVLVDLLFPYFSQIETKVASFEKENGVKRENKKIQKVEQNATDSSTEASSDSSRPAPKTLK